MNNHIPRILRTYLIGNFIFRCTLLSNQRNRKTFYLTCALIFFFNRIFKDMYLKNFKAFFNTFLQTLNRLIISNDMV